MSKPLFDRTQGTTNSYFGWTDNQLLRRPPPTSATAVDGQYCYCVDINSSVPSVTTTTPISFPHVDDPTDLVDVVPLDMGTCLDGRVDNDFYSFDATNSAITILQGGTYDITGQAFVHRNNSSAGCDFTRSIELRVGPKVIIADYTTPIPRSATPFSPAWWDVDGVDVFNTTCWAAPDSGAYFTMTLEVSERLIYDSAFPDSYDGTSVQMFCSHDADEPVAFEFYLQIVRLAGAIFLQGE